MTIHLAIQCCSKWRFPASYAARHTIQLCVFYRWKLGCRLLRDFSSVHRVYLLTAPGLVQASLGGRGSECPESLS